MSISELAIESSDVLEWLEWFCACFVELRVVGGDIGLRFGR